MNAESARGLTVVSTAAALVVGIGLGAVILLTATPQFGLHEIAGLLLLGLLAAATVGAWVSRSQDRRRPSRAILALSVLIAMGASGAALAVGALPAGASDLPAILLVALVAAMIETLRVSWGAAPATGRGAFRRPTVPGRGGGTLMASPDPADDLAEPSPHWPHS